MAKYRMINTRFWNDGWIRTINPLDRYLFIYLLTNEHTNLCGIYELPISTISLETGIKEHEIEKIMLPRLQPKVFYVDGWIYIKNFIKHHQGTEKTLKGIENAKSEVPSHISVKIKEIDAPYMPHACPSGSSASASASASAFNNAPPVGDIEELLGENGRITHDYQFIGLDVYEKTGAPQNKKSECIRLAKIYPHLIDKALSFCLDYPNKELKWKMFLWKLNDLKKNGGTSK